MPVDPKVIYLEADEEITSVVDKLRKTEFTKVVLVVPKEASLLQSIVNLKLLKRQAENLEKSIAVVTTDKVGRNLAEKVGLMTASKLNEELKVAESFDIPEQAEAPVAVAAVEEAGPLEETNEVLSEPKKTPRAVVQDEEESIFIKEGEDDEVKAEPEKSKETPDWTKKQIEEPEEQNLMPRFPLKKGLLIGGVVTLFLLTLGFYFLPRARATIMVSAEKKPVSLSFKGEKDASLDTEKAIIPTQTVEVTKNDTKKFQATGKKNVGTKASASLVILNGSGAPLNLATFSPVGHSELVFTAPTPVTVANNDKATVYVEATQPGDQYNGYTKFIAVKANRDDVIVNASSATSGGVSKEVKYVTQGDIDTAKVNFSKDLLDQARTDFNKKVEQLKVLDDSKKEEITSATAEPGVNKEADTFDLSVTVGIKALAYNLDDIGKLIKAEVERQLGFSKQIIDDGASDAQVAVESFDLASGTVEGDIKTNTYVSAKLDEGKIKEDLIGLNETKSTEYLKGIDGVQDAEVNFLPSFIKLFPRIKSHIYLTIKVADKDS